MTTKRKTKRNPADLTGRNLKAVKKREASIKARLELLENGCEYLSVCLANFEDYFIEIEKRLKKLEGKKKCGR